MNNLIKLKSKNFILQLRTLEIHLTLFFHQNLKSFSTNKLYPLQSQPRVIPFFINYLKILKINLLFKKLNY